MPVARWPAAGAAVASALASRLQTTGSFLCGILPGSRPPLSPSPRAQGGEGGKERREYRRGEGGEERGGEREEEGEEEEVEEGEECQGGLPLLRAAFHCPLSFHQIPAPVYVHPMLCIWPVWAHTGHRETQGGPTGPVKRTTSRVLGQMHSGG